MNEQLFSLSEFPRPDLAREPWVCLDGEWDFCYDRLDAGVREEWFRNRTFRRKIRVPFCVESEASGVHDETPPGRVWYQRTFDPGSLAAGGRRILLHFGAVDYEAGVWLNGNFVGAHEGGYTPFSFDVTDLIQLGENTLTVRVRDTIDPRIPRGKQSFTGHPWGILYTTVTGIWQSVWLEAAGRSYIRSYNVDADADTGRATARCRLAGDAGAYRLRVDCLAPDGSTQRVETDATKSDGDADASVEILWERPAPWSTDTPALYGLTFTLLDAAGAAVDRTRGYFGFRKIEVRDGRVLLNNKPLYQKLVLNQGYFPKGLYTPLDWNDFRRDVELIRELGFNGARMHQKIENPKFLFWCDALGCILWEEMPSAYTWSSRMRNAISEQWPRVVERDRNHPCVLVWVPFNESWGFAFLLGSKRVREYVEQMYRATKSLDPTRLVVDNSGFEHVITDLLDLHHYLGDVETCREYYNSLRDPKNMRYQILNVVQRLHVQKHPVSPLAPGVEYGGEPIIISEYGGFGFYKTTDKPLLGNFSDYTIAIAEDDMIQGYGYTQFADTEQESNGLLTLDRQPKIPIEEIRRVNQKVDEITRGRERG